MAGMRGYVQLNKHAHHLNSLKQYAEKLGGRRPGSPRGTVASASEHEDAQLGHDTPAEEKKNDDRGGHANEPQSPSVPAEETEAQANPAVAEGGVETPTVSPAFRGRASVDGNPAGRGDRGSRRREPEGMRRMAASVLSTSSYLVIVQESHLPCCRVIRCSFCICLGSIFNLSVFCTGVICPPPKTMDFGGVGFFHSSSPCTTVTGLSCVVNSFGDISICPPPRASPPPSPPPISHSASTPFYSATQISRARSTLWGSTLDRSEHRSGCFCFL